MVDSGKSSLENKSWSLSSVSSRKVTLKEYFNDIPLWNKGGEFINDCKHPNKLLLKSLKRNDSTDFH